MQLHAMLVSARRARAIVLVTAAAFLPGALSAAETFNAGAASADPALSGVLDYAIGSSYQTPGASNILRVLAPSTGVNANTRFLYVLPVQAGLPSSPNYNPGYGDAMTVAQQLHLNDRYNVVVVAPSFDRTGPDPWYANNRTNPAIREESYITDHIVPFVDSLYPQAQDTRMLMGYSKSGWGALNLIFQHPELFAAAAAWDAPLMMTSLPTPYPGTDAVFGSDADFQANYRLDTHLDGYAAAFQSTNRLWLGVNPGGNDFEAQTHTFAQLLAAHGMLHTLDAGTDTLLHSWESGWVLGAMDFLNGAAPVLAPAMAVPEPAAWLTLIIGIAIVLAGRARAVVRVTPAS